MGNLKIKNYCFSYRKGDGYRKGNQLIVYTPIFIFVYSPMAYRTVVQTFSNTSIIIFYLLIQKGNLIQLL